MSKKMVHDGRYETSKIGDWGKFRDSFDDIFKKKSKKSKKEKDSVSLDNKENTENDETSAKD